MLGGRVRTSFYRIRCRAQHDLRPCTVVRSCRPKQSWKQGRFSTDYPWRASSDNSHSTTFYRFAPGRAIFHLKVLGLAVERRLVDLWFFVSSAPLRTRPAQTSIVEEQPILAAHICR